MSVSPAPPRVIVVTGASSGIGAAVCERRAVPDAVLVLHARPDASYLTGQAIHVNGGLTL